MSLTPEQEESLAELVDRLVSPEPGLMLLRYRAAVLVDLIHTRLRQRLSDKKVFFVFYSADAEEGDTGSATQVVVESCRLAGEVKEPVLLLVPVYQSGKELGSEDVAGFWKRLNANREKMGDLNARILLFLDPTQEKFAVAYAKDLLSWCAPKFSLTFDLGLGNLSMNGDRSGKSEKSRVELGMDEEVILTRALSPLWDEIRASNRALTESDIRRLVIPLLQNALNDGRVHEAKELVDAVGELPIQNATTRGRLLMLKGDLAIGSGRTDAGLEFYTKAIAVLNEQFSNYPASLEAARDLSVSLYKLGDFYAARGREGDADEGLRCYERALAESEKLLAANPESGQAARDLKVSLNRLGDYYMTRGGGGDGAKALRYHERALAVSEKLLAANPMSFQAIRDVSVGLGQLGDCYRARGGEGDDDQALRCYERALAELEKLLVKNPGSVQASRDVGVTMNKLGNFYLLRGREGDREKALACYQRDLEISEEILAANPESEQAARDVMLTLQRVAVMKVARAGGEREALDFQRRALKMALDLRERNTGNAFYEQTAAVTAYFTFQRAQAAGDEELMRQALSLCFTILDGQLRRGAELDAQMRELYEELRPMFQPQE